MDTGLSNGCGSVAADRGFKAAYTGTLQKGATEALKIPCDARKVPLDYSRIVGLINVAQTGVDVLITALVDGVEVDTAILLDGDLNVYWDVTPGTVDADSVVTFMFDWVGTPAVLGISLTMRLE